ncbi:myo-inositol 2-dehydrogenase [Rhodococcus sp. 06-412-2C]|uniref:Gfo/Idh/MocA family protein n=1 Tax=unclassified Rhodococcus (in: high G+C Gram-positive bacteria) TaxID=192944 RepID=UPI000B9B701E|nr:MULTISPECIES: Gfo/Idh/MocA family oxidoreductase [unclassified Rhodococcus (in: high G+C Gram-positive bacteria)]OZC87140.1 myo-inositol 2-dehydrogenase [Rhodococcus sp. 06-412-2C]OZD00581.1 myo-inositol 2-dehydrogenase [Rhodococcus sp. 06-412-2B]
MVVRSTRSVRVGVAGFGWMGRVHTQAYSRLTQHYPDLGLRPELAMVADELEGRADDAADQFGFAAATTDWHEIQSDPTIEAVSITAPNFLHRSIGTAMVEAGKHIWIEKPVGLTADDARAVALAADKAGVQTAVGFNYRNAPAVEEAKALIESGELGTITHARFRFFSDYAAHPDGALSWRFERARGGNGVLGDLASHGADLVYYLLGDIESLVADTAIFVPERAKPSGSATGHALAAGGERGAVENEDFVSSQLRLHSGARVVLEASRVAVGDQNAYGFEIHGTKGAVSWDFRRLGELSLSTGDRYQDQAASTVYVGPSHGEYGAFQPGSASSMGYDDLKVIEAMRFFRSIADGKPCGATLQDAVRSAGVLDAMSESVASGRWIQPGT